MIETLIAAAGSLVVGVTTTWLTVGGQAQRLRSTIDQELTTLARLDPESGHAVRLRGVLDDHFEWYLGHHEKRYQRGARIGAAITNLAGIAATIALVGPSVDSNPEALAVGSMVGLVVALTQWATPAFLGSGLSLARRLRGM